MSANCSSITCWTAWAAARTGNLRRSKVGLSQAPKPQNPATFGNCEVIPTKRRVRGRAQSVAQVDQVLVACGEHNLAGRQDDADSGAGDDSRNIEFDKAVRLRAPEASDR